MISKAFLLIYIYFFYFFPQALMLSEHITEGIRKGWVLSLSELSLKGRLALGTGAGRPHREAALRCHRPAGCLSCPGPRALCLRGISGSGAASQGRAAGPGVPRSSLRRCPASGPHRPGPGVLTDALFLRVPGSGPHTTS